VSETRQEKEIKSIWLEHYDVKLFLFAHDLIVYIENTKSMMKKVLMLTGEFNKVIRYKINIQKLNIFLYGSSKSWYLN
jgi:hypothetical protein